MPESFTHGSSAQRVRWFKRGFESGDMNQCNTFNPRPLTARRTALAVLAGLCLAGGASALPRHAPVPGAWPSSTWVGAGRPKARLGQRSLAVVEEQGRWYALLGIPLDAVPGSREIAAALAGGERRLTVAVAASDYPDPAPDHPGPAQGRTQRRRSRPHRGGKSGHRGDQGRVFRRPSRKPPFVLPAAGPLSSRFGLKRLFNGLPRNPHAGLDVAVGNGAPVQAPAPGRVAEVGDFFFNGHTVLSTTARGSLPPTCTFPASMSGPARWWAGANAPGGRPAPAAGSPAPPALGGDPHPCGAAVDRSFSPAP